MKIVYRTDNYNDEVCQEFLYKSTRQLNIKSTLIKLRSTQRTHRYISDHFLGMKISFHSNGVACVDSTDKKHVILSCIRSSSHLQYTWQISMQTNISNIYMHWQHSFDGKSYVDHARRWMPIHTDKNYNRTFVVSSVVFR